MRHLATEQAAAEGKVLVELLVFSGKENPKWWLNEAEAADLARTLAERQLTEAADPPRGAGLGYNGFRLGNRGKVPHLPTELIVRDGVVTERTATHERHMQDSAGIEERLLAQAEDRGFGEIIAQGRPPFPESWTGTSEEVVS